jgi:histone deacetylase HOS3
MESLPAPIGKAALQIQDRDKSPQNDVKPDATALADTNTGSSIAIHGPSSAIFIQDACFQHRFIRSRDASAVVERPERLRAVKLGLAAAIARIEGAVSTSTATNKQISSAVPTESIDPQSDDLAAALGRMNLATRTTPSPESTIPVFNSSASVDILNNPAVKFVHGDVDGDVYLENLRAWARDSQDKIMKGESEIPDGLSQGDLYCKSPSPPEVID